MMNEEGIYPLCSECGQILNEKEDDSGHSWWWCEECDTERRV